MLFFSGIPSLCYKQHIPMRHTFVVASTALVLSSFLSFGCASKSAKIDRNIYKTSQTFVEKGYELARDHKYDEAIHVLTEAIKFDPDNENAYIFRSSIYLTLDNLKEAIDDANRALKINKRNEFAYVNRAHALIALKQYDQAVQDCDNALRVNPEFYPAYVNRGTAFYYKDKLMEAIRDLTIAVDRLPEGQRAHPYYVRSKCYDKLGKEGLASQDRELSRKLGYNPDHSRIY